MLRRLPGSRRVTVIVALAAVVAIVVIATTVFAGPAGARPGMSCNPDPGHGTPGCHREATTTTAAPTTTTQAPTTTTKPQTTTTKPRTTTTKPSTATTTGSQTTTTKPATSTTGAAISTTQATPTTQATTTTVTGGTVGGPPPSSTATTAVTGGPTTSTAATATDVRWECNTCHEGVGPDFAASLPGHVHANQGAVRAVYTTRVTFSIVTGSILAVGLLIVATSIILRAVARARRRSGLRQKGR